MRSAIILAGLFMALACSMPGAQASEITLQVGITGSSQLRGLEDPVTVARLPEVSSLLRALADQPRDARFIAEALQGSEATLERLVDLGLIGARGQAYAIDFNYLTLEDHAMLIEVLAPYAEDLAQAYRDAWREFQAIFAAYDVPGVPAGETAYAVLGAMSLDWDGLDLTAEKDLRITANNLPEGRDFILWAKEQSTEINVRGLYWGSHNADANGARFTSFGDHHTLPRMALPDLLWNTGTRVAAIDGAGRPLRQSFYAALAPYYQDDFLADLAGVLRLLRREPQSPGSIAGQSGLTEDRAAGILELLRELQYVDRDGARYRLATPYFSIADRPMTEAARALSWRLMSAWLDQNAPAIEESLGQLTALRYGVPYRELFSEIWHYIFGLTNRALVESGHFADPYARERVAQANIPFAFDLELLGLRTEMGALH